MVLRAIFNTILNLLTKHFTLSISFISCRKHIFTSIPNTKVASVKIIFFNFVVIRA